MLQTIENYLNKLGADMWAYCLIGVIGVVFVVGLVLTFVGGDFNRFKKCAKKFLKTPVAKNATETAKNMPVKIRKLYKRAKMTGEKPSDVINFDACISSTYASSFASRFTITMIYASLTVTAIALGVFMLNGSLAGLPIVAIVGGLLSLIAGIVATVNYNGAVKTYNKYIDALDKLSKGGNYDGAAEANAGRAFAATAGAAQEVVSDEVPVYSASESEPIVEEAVVTDTVVSEPVYAESEPQSASYDTTFEKSNKLDIEVEEEPEGEQPVFAESAAPKNNDLNEIEEEIRREKEEAERAERERQRAEARAAAIERARAAQANAAQSVVTPPPPVQPQTTDSVVTPPPPQAQSAASGSSADDVIARIEQINRDGAPLATMKEVALLLQQERAKPENKTPEQQRKLNEALSSLLKAMSSATRK